MKQAIDSATLASFGVQNNQIVCNSGETLTVLAIARVLPNQRLVCKCLLKASEVYAKIFIGLRANTHAAREASGTKLLFSANILTPKLLLETTTNNQPVIIYEAIENAINAEDFMHQHDFFARQDMAKKLAKTVAQHHNANLLQTDIHLKNFLISGEKVYTIDGDGIQATNSLSQKQHNLATLLSKLDVLDNDFMQATVEAYYVAINEKFTLSQLLKIGQLTQKIRLKSASNYADKKVFRQCSDVNVIGLKGLFCAASSRAKINIPNNMAELAALILPQNLLKNGNTCTVALAKIDSQQVVIKRYNIKNIWHAVGRAFRQSRAAKSWANAHRLIFFGISTAAPIALIEQRNFSFIFGGLRGKAYFLSEYIDAPDVTEYFAQTQHKTERAEVVKNIVTLFYKLYLLQISHGDMKSTNIKIQASQPVLIDLDSMRQHDFAALALKAHARDLRRFMRNWQHSNALYNAFVKAFKVVYADNAPLKLAEIEQNK